MVYLLTSFTYLAPVFNSVLQQNRRLRKFSNFHNFVILHSRNLYYLSKFAYFSEVSCPTSFRNPKEGDGSVVPAEQVGGASAMLLFLIVGNHKLRL